jgi:hypothetical protein
MLYQIPSADFEVMITTNASIMTAPKAIMMTKNKVARMMNEVLLATLLNLPSRDKTFVHVISLTLPDRFLAERTH